MEWVFDASVTLAWAFDDERTPATERLLDYLAITPAIVPQIWPIEVANVLLISTRRRRIDRDGRDAFLKMLAAQTIEVDAQTTQLAMTTILHLAEQNRLTVYDAAYLELAMRLRIPLATLDDQLRQAANASGVALL